MDEAFEAMSKGQMPESRFTISKGDRSEIADTTDNSFQE